MDAWVTVVEPVKGRRVSRTLPLNVPVDLATGRLENLSDLQLREARRDLNHEYLRRTGGLFS